MKLKRLVKRGGIYHFRVKVPDDLVCYIGKKELHKSLGACKYNDVAHQAFSYSLKINSLFDLVRGSKYNQETVNNIVKGIFSENLEKNPLQPLPNSFVASPKLSDLSEN